MEHPDIFDIADPPLLDKGKWIGKGRKYPKDPKDIPCDLVLYLQSLQEIPLSFAKAAFPEHGMPVKEFLELNLLEVSFDLLYIPPTRCFSRLTANEDLTCLLRRRIPSKGFIASLKESFRQAVLDGNFSDTSCKRSFTKFTVLAIYSKSAGKAGKHSWVPEASNIAAVSNIPMQLFDHMLGVQFRATPAGQVLHVKRFCLLPSSAFLCVLGCAPTMTENGMMISQQDWALFRKLKENASNIAHAISSLSSHRGKGNLDMDDEDIEDY